MSDLARSALVASSPCPSQQDQYCGVFNVAPFIQLEMKVSCCFGQLGGKFALCRHCHKKSIFTTSGLSLHARRTWIKVQAVFQLRCLHAQQPGRCFRFHVNQHIINKPFRDYWPQKRLGVGGLMLTGIRGNEHSLIHFIALALLQMLNNGRREHQEIASRAAHATTAAVNRGMRWKRQQKKLQKLQPEYLLRVRLAFCACLRAVITSSEYDLILLQANCCLLGG